MVVYDKQLERALRARKAAFEMATRNAGHTWHEVDLTHAFSAWLGRDDYRDAYFASPEDLQLKIDAEFTSHVADLIRAVLRRPEANEDSVVGVFGAGSLFGFARISEILKRVEGDIRGRLVIFFPGHYVQSSYRLLDARDGWNYLAVPIALTTPGSLS
jgi:hypothetical protein